jgi:hypothetical protein
LYLILMKELNPNRHKVRHLPIGSQFLDEGYALG